MIIIVMMSVLLQKTECVLSCIETKKKNVPSKKGQITFFHFNFFFFFPATLGSIAIPLNSPSILLDVAVSTTGLHYRTSVCRKKLVLAYYFPSHSSKNEISHCVSKDPLNSYYIVSFQK